MRFIKATTKHTVQETKDIVLNFSPFERQHFYELENSFESVDFVAENGYIGLYAIVSDRVLERMLSEYIKCGISFSYEDLTKSILFGISPIVSDLLEKKHLDSLIKKFIEENLDADTVLDKINEMKLAKKPYILTEYDIKVLESY